MEPISTDGTLVTIVLAIIVIIAVLTIVMARRGGRLAAPGSLGIPYDREQR